MPEFDLPVGVMELAEATGPCGNCDGLGYHGTEGSEMHPRHPCQRCGGTGRIPLFPSLRVECPNLERVGSASRWHKACCEGRGWVPVSDPRVACWILTRWLAERGCSLWRRPDGTWGVDDEEQRWDMGKTIAEGATAEEAVICAALVKEKYA